MDLKIEALRGKKVAVHCKTQEEWIAVSNIAEIPLTNRLWKYEGADTCIYPCEALYSSLEYAKSSTGYPIITAADFIASNKKEVMTELNFDDGNRFGGMQLNFRNDVLNISTGIDGTYLSKEHIQALRDFLNQLP